MKLVGIRSRSLLRIAHLDIFLAPWGRSVALDAYSAGAGELVAIADWSHGPGLEASRSQALNRGLPFLAMDQGFLRCVDRNSPHPWSLLVDDLGLHHDATHPSRIELLIEESASVGPAATELLHLIRTHRLSRYNDRPDLDEGRMRDKAPLVLVIDQERDDPQLPTDARPVMSAMLEAALDENPSARVMLCGYPGTAANLRKGHLAAIADRRSVTLFESDISWPSLASRASRLYTATSLAGLEALALGVPVSCFGRPFYAGWGLTDDRASLPRRSARPALAQFMAAAYERYPRYIDPVHARPATALELARRIIAARDSDSAKAGTTTVLGISRWKRSFVRKFVVSRHGTMQFARISRRSIARTARRGGRAIVWAAREPPWLASAAQSAGVALSRLEDGFLRSVGLGSDFTPALSLVVDDLGIYFDPRRESRLERMLNEHDFSPALLDQARSLRHRLVERRLSKYNLQHRDARVAPPQKAAGRRVLLVPGQVEDDGSVRLGSPKVRSNLELLAAVRTAVPEATILYKPHPDVERGNRPGHVAENDARRFADDILTGWDAPSALELADEVHTMTSLLGFEALLRGYPVTVYGLPFYSGLGLTTDILSWPRQRRRVDIETLVAGTYLLYPQYIDLATGLPITVFDALELIEHQREMRARHGLGTAWDLPMQLAGMWTRAVNSVLSRMAR
jgi:capsular polysaccharide export protein